jgi:hypothetical protein
MRQLLTLILLFAAIQRASAVDAISNEVRTALIPVLANSGVPGVAGSRWLTTLAVYNASTDLIALLPCGIPNRCPPEVFMFNPRTTERNPPLGFTTAGVNGRLIYYTAKDAPSLFFKLTVFDASRNGRPAEIPVVTEDRFRTSVLEMLDIPLDDSSRTTLRIYDVDDRDGASVTVRMFDERERIIGEQNIRFTSSGYAHPGQFPVAPAFIVLPLSFEPRADSRVRIEIEPATEGLRFWAFVSVVENATSSVTIYSP